MWTGQSGVLTIAIKQAFVCDLDRDKIFAKQHSYFVVCVKPGVARQDVKEHLDKLRTTVTGLGEKTASPSNFLYSKGGEKR